MKRKTFILVLVGVFFLQAALFFLIDQTVFHKEQVYKTVSEDGKNQVIIYKDQEEYVVQLKKKGTKIHEERLEGGFKHVKEEASWINSTFVFITYVDDDFKDVQLSFDFVDKETLADEDGFVDAVKKAQKKDTQEEKKRLEKEEKISTETGLSLTKARTVAVTYDYGKHWKDTGISVDFMTFYESDQLRLSDESYLIDKDFSYIYYCHSNGWLHYVYSKDEGNTWHINDTKAEAINTLWFQSFLKEDKQPAFFLADKTYGSEDCLDYYDSSDDGTAFTKHHLTLNKDMNYLADVTYIRSDLMFVSFYEDSSLYYTKDQGSTFQNVEIKGNEEIQYVEAPEEKDGTLALIAHTQSGKTLNFQSIDDGASWTQN